MPSLSVFQATVTLSAYGKCFSPHKHLKATLPLFRKILAVWRHAPVMLTDYTSDGFCNSGFSCVAANCLGRASG